MFRVGHGVKQVGEHRCPEEGHHAAHGGAGGDEGPARTVPVDEEPDGRDGNDRQGGDAVVPGPPLRAEHTAGWQPRAG